MPIVSPASVSKASQNKIQKISAVKLLLDSSLDCPNGDYPTPVSSSSTNSPSAHRALTSASVYDSVASGQSIQFPQVVNPTNPAPPPIDPTNSTTQLITTTHPTTNPSSTTHPTTNSTSASHPTTPTFPTATNPLASLPPNPIPNNPSISPSSSVLTSFSSLQDQYWSRLTSNPSSSSSFSSSSSSSNYRPAATLNQFSLSNPHYSTPSFMSISFESSKLQPPTAAFSVPAPPLQLPLPKNIPIHNSLHGNPFGFFFAEDPLTAENALDAFQSVSHHHHLNLNTFPSQPPETLQPHTYQINSDTAQSINDYLSFTGQVFRFSPREISTFIKAAWLNHEYVNFVLHRPSFIANNSHIPLLATLTFLGIYCSHSQHAHLIPMYNGLKGKHAIALHETQHCNFISKLTILQSCSLLIWRNFVRSSSAIGAHIISDPNYMSIEALISTAGPYLKLGGAFTPQRDTRIYYQNASVDSYQFIFQETSVQEIMDQQWQTWVQHESCIRVLHFLMFVSKERLAITKQGHVYPFVDFDVPMTSPDSLWQASSTEMFFHTVGPTRTIRTLSYVHILKLMLRMPSLTEYGTKSVKLSGTSDRTTWTLGPYVVVLYGLATVAWGVGTGSPQLFDAVQKSFDKDYDPSTSAFRRSIDSNGNFVADHGLESRIFYAFEMLEVLCERTTRKFDEADFAPHLNALHGNSTAPGPPGTRNALTHIALEQGSPPPWLCTVAGCLHFQLCYFSLYRDTPFVNDLIAALPARLAHINQSVWTLSREETEHYLLFGQSNEVYQNVRQFYRWIHHGRTENCIAITTYYMINLVTAKNSVAFGGLEASVMRELLFHSLIFLWTWDYSIRKRTKQPPKRAEIPHYLLEFWMNCESLAPVPTNKRYLIKQSLGFLLDVWQKTRKSFIDPAEKFARGNKPPMSVSSPNMGAGLELESQVSSGVNNGSSTMFEEVYDTPGSDYGLTNSSHQQNQHQLSSHPTTPISDSGAGPCMEIFMYLDSALRLDSSEPLNKTLCDLADFVSSSGQ